MTEGLKSVTGNRGVTERTSVMPFPVPAALNLDTFTFKDAPPKLATSRSNKDAEWNPNESTPSARLAERYTTYRYSPPPHTSVAPGTLARAAVDSPEPTPTELVAMIYVPSF
jgi:hypothetical protein